MPATGLGPVREADARDDNWRRHLIDLSHRNRLIAFKATKATTLTVAAPSVAELRLTSWLGAASEA